MPAKKKTAKKKTAKKAPAKVEDKADPGEIARLKEHNNRLSKKLEKYADGRELIVHSVKAAVKELDYSPPALPKPKKDRRKNISEEIAILHISDTQIGKITSTYNSEVAYHRLSLLVDRTIDITAARRTNAKIEEIHVFLGGDIVEGEQIFPHQAHLIDQAVVDQAMSSAVAISHVIERLLCVYKKVKVICVRGNHGRNGPKKTSAHPKTNWDNVCYEYTRLLLEGTTSKKRYAGRLDFVISDEFYYVDYTYDWGHLIVHGDQISGGFAGFPWYGVGKKIFKWADSIQKAWDYLWMGHFHTLNAAVFNHKMLLANGTTESDNDFALEVLASQGEPVQRLAFFNKRRGLIADYPVYLNEIGDRLPTIKRYERALANKE